MTFPDDAVMESLRALAEAEALVIEDGALEAAVPDPTTPDGVRFHPIAPDHLDALEERGWVSLFDGRDGLEVTHKGDYALDRWLRSRGNKGRAPRVAAVRRRMFGRRLSR